jgi:CheY-like chemotaxis protein
MTGEPFDVLVSDIGLPDGTGVDLIRQIRQKYGNRPPALALTGYGMEDDIARCKAAGFTDHLTKPVNLQKLEAAIQHVARQANGRETPSVT